MAEKDTGIPGLASAAMGRRFRGEPADLIGEARHRVRARARMVRLLGEVLDGGPLALDHADVLELATGISALSWL